LGLGGRRKHTLQDNPILQARILTVEGSSSTLGVNYTFGEVLPSLEWRRGPRISTLKDDVIITPGSSPPGSSPRIRLEQAARPITPRPRPAVPQRHQLGPRPRQINSGVGPANGRPGQAPADQVFFSGQLTLGEAVQTTNRRVLVLENEEKIRLRAKNTYMFRPRQPQ
jgi:hypothetical protein